MSVDIYIREKNGTREIRIPILPEKFTFSCGDATFITIEIMGWGEVAIPSGTELASFSWEGELPGSRRKNDPRLRGGWIVPSKYRSILEEWKRKGILLNLMITGYPVNNDVYCKSFETIGEGAFGDINYEVEFIQARSITISSSKVDNTPKRQTSTARTYTIKSGDTLWGIAKQFYGDGTKWTVIYEANKDIIEKTAKKYGRSSSDNGHWIYPGVTLTIPDLSDGKTNSTTTSSSNKGSTSNTGNNNNTGNTGSTVVVRKPSSTKQYEEQYTASRLGGVSSMVSKLNNHTRMPK